MSDIQPPKILAEGRFLRLVQRNGWEYVERRNTSGIVGILAITDDGRLLLVEQYRPPLGKRVIELPAGLAGDVAGQEHEALAAAARRELLEETGYDAREMLFLAEGAASAGLSTEIITLYRATGLTKTGRGGGDDSEDIQLHEVPVAQAPQWLAARAAEGLVIDLKVYCGLYFAVAR